MFTNSTTMVQNKVLFKKLPYDPDKDFALVAWFNTGHLPTASTRTCRSRTSRSSPPGRSDRKVSAATYGAGSLRPCRGRDAQPALRLKMEAVHYRGEGADVAGRGLGRRPERERQLRLGELPFLQRARSRSIAVPTLERMRKLPDVPTFYEQGLTEKAFQVRGWVGCAAPAGTPEDDRAEALRPHGRGRQDRARPEDHRHVRHRRRRRATAPISRRSSTRKGRSVLGVIKSLNIEPQ